MIDLHTHTTESDGTLTPAELVAAAREAGLEALAISDHDTLVGCDQALPAAAQVGIELVCAVEVSTRLPHPAKPCGQSVHVLGYFLLRPPDDGFRRWLAQQSESRRLRNACLAGRLQELGFEVTLEEVTARGGRLWGRRQFARLLVEKGYVGSTGEAFRRYLGETGKAYVPRETASTTEAIRRISEAGGLACLAHPGRLKIDVESAVEALRSHGLAALEVYSSDHTQAQTAFFLSLARRYQMAVSGGSDFHGDSKPGVLLGTGRDGSLSVPRAVLEDLRHAAREKSERV